MTDLPRLAGEPREPDDLFGPVEYVGDASYGGVDPDGSLWEVYVPAPEPALTGAWLVGFALLAGLAIITFGLIGFGVLFA